MYFYSLNTFFGGWSALAKPYWDKGDGYRRIKLWLAFKIGSVVSSPHVSRGTGGKLWYRLKTMSRTI